MSSYFYNTLTRRKEEFHSMEEGIVRMYTCGPTVYNYAHIGNFRAYMFEDLLRRYLKFKGYRVIQVMNITDVDDKIIRDSVAQKVKIRDFTKPYQKAFFEDLDALGIERAEHYPAATAHITEMVAMIRRLLEKGFAYRSEDGSIYYKVSQFPQYGQLAHLNVDEMRRSGRVLSDEYEKEELRDFALWKAWKPEDGDVYWETELGKGRPGWHIECSAMSMKYLGSHFDLHTGGVDNIFPHHENEIAQSEAANDEKFVNYWLHCEHLQMEGEKMSKSLGNIVRLHDLLAEGVDPKAIRYVLLSTHYRQKLNFTTEKLATAAKNITRLRDFMSSLAESDPGAESVLQSRIREAVRTFESSLDDDLNISEALAAVFALIKTVNVHREAKPLSKADAEAIRDFLERADTVLNLLEASEDRLSAEEEQLIEERNRARREKNWAEADRLRDLLAEKGIVLEDSPAGTQWKRKLKILP